MKNQYFGDKRDYFKYDLLLDLTEGISGIERLTIIPMLTEPDGTREGSLTKYPVGSRRPGLHKLLLDQRDSGSRNIDSLASLLTRKELCYYRPADASSFTHDARACYFGEVPERTLRSAVVFLDPDIGLPPKRDMLPPKKNLAKYVLWEDVVQLTKRMSPGSLLVIYQHLQFNKHKTEGDIWNRCGILAQRTGVPRAGYITDRDIAFLLVSRDDGTFGEANRMLQAHAEKHKLRIGQIPDPKPGRPG